MTDNFTIRVYDENKILVKTHMFSEYIDIHCQGIYKSNLNEILDTTKYNREIHPSNNKIHNAYVKTTAYANEISYNYCGTSAAQAQQSCPIGGAVDCITPGYTCPTRQNCYNLNDNITYKNGCSMSSKGRCCPPNISPPPKPPNTNTYNYCGASYEIAVKTCINEKGRELQCVNNNDCHPPATCFSVSGDCPYPNQDLSMVWEGIEWANDNLSSWGWPGHNNYTQKKLTNFINPDDGSLEMALTPVDETDENKKQIEDYCSSKSKSDPNPNNAYQSCISSNAWQSQSQVLRSKSLHSGGTYRWTINAKDLSHNLQYSNIVSTIYLYYSNPSVYDTESEIDIEFTLWPNPDGTIPSYTQTNNADFQNWRPNYNASESMSNPTGSAVSNNNDTTIGKRFVNVDFSGAETIEFKIEWLTDNATITATPKDSNGSEISSNIITQTLWTKPKDIDFSNLQQLWGRPAAEGFKRGTSEAYMNIMMALWIYNPETKSKIQTDKFIDDIKEGNIKMTIKDFSFTEDSTYKNLYDTYGPFGWCKELTSTNARRRCFAPGSQYHSKNPSPTPIPSCPGRVLTFDCSGTYNCQERYVEKDAQGTVGPWNCGLNSAGECRVSGPIPCATPAPGPLGCSCDPDISRKSSIK